MVIQQGLQDSSNRIQKALAHLTGFTLDLVIFPEVTALFE
jgi:hypothetical protein